MWKVFGFIALIILATQTESKIPPQFSSKNTNVHQSLYNPRKLSTNNSNLNFRLPNNTYPLHYDIHLTTHVHESKFEFEGHVTINFVSKSAPFHEITLHAKRLKNIKIKLLDVNRNVVENDLEYDTDKVRDFLTIKPLKSLVINQIYYLEFDYDGELRDDNVGFYKSSYVNGLNKTVWIAATQFQSVEARSAFPCWDEPNIRTPFKVRITHGQNYQAVSNMLEKVPVESIIPGYVTTEFKQSFSMPTYLVAFIVSDFKNVIDSIKPIVQRVFAKPQSIENGDAKMALKFGQEILTKLAEYLDVPYFNGLLPKMDQVALSDFDAGAMENVGLVTFREEYLLHNASIDTTRQKENVLRIISHEFAHMYFGDLVAPNWWSYVWLNEGFATLYEFYLPSLIYESDRLMDSFVLNVIQRALEFDGHSQRPMSFYVQTPDEIGDIFDRIAYDKSGSVLRMLQNAIGDETWRKGLKYYLSEHSFKDATPTDLHVNLQKAMNEDGLEALDIADIMLSWETQSGYPLITVNNTNNGNLTFNQERFSYGDLPESRSSEGLWYVPINYITARDSVILTTKADLWMNQQKVSVNVGWNEDDWIIVNLQQGYYYRVNYNNRMWMLLIKQLHSCHDKIDLRNRGQLIDDSFSLARAGIIPYDIPLGILKYLKNEIDYVPWQSAYNSILLLNRLLSGLSMHNKYRAFIRNLVEPFYKHIGSDVIENEHKFKRYSRTIAFNLACRFGHESCLQQMKSKIKDEKIHPDLQEVIYSNGLRHASDEKCEEMIERMLNSKNQAERTVLIRAFASSEEEELLESLLELTVKNDRRLRLQEKYRIFSAIPSSGTVGAKIAMEFIKDYYKEIHKISSSLIRSTINDIAPLISSDRPIKQFNLLLDFLLDKEVINVSDKSSVLKIVEATKKWQEKYAKKIETWLDVNGSTRGSFISTGVLIFMLVINCFVNSLHK